MPKSVASKQTVVVAGDVTIDWNLARIKAAKMAGTTWNTEDTTRAHGHPGGACLIAELVKALAADLPGQVDWIVHSIPDPDVVRPDDARYHHSYTTWSLEPRDDKAKEASVWRVDEFLGIHRAAGTSVGDEDLKRVANDTPEADLVALDDADLGFRDDPALWPLAINQGRPWIILKMARPVAQGRLWEHLRQHHAERVVAVTTVDDLRLSEVQVSRGLSWERTAEDLMWELKYNPHIRGLSECAHVVVSFDTAGALLLSGGRSDQSATLFFDPQVIEGMWAQHYPGAMIGYTSCLAASLASQLFRPPDQQDIAQGVQSGLAAMRRLHVVGYGASRTNPRDAQVVFPTQEVITEIGKGEKLFAEAEVRDPARFLRDGGDDGERPH
ncbi:MAG TPA: ATPase, partial [Blastocatellia bacterium]|nr:ATPase [Blastocatellia bacterium]